MSWWGFWKGKAEQADFVKDFLKINQQPTAGIRAIDQLQFTVIDTETSGLDTARDSILSFGAVKIVGAKILVSSSVEWYPASSPARGETTPIHGLVAISDQISTEEFARRLLDYLGDTIVVGQHVGFDLEMIAKLLRPFGIDRLPNPILDTSSLAIRLEHGPQADRRRINLENYSLDALCSRYGIDPEDRHTAGGDAFLTAQLLLKLLKQCRLKGIGNFRDLMKSY